jgi:O-antigen/teichoic acid export membrane protein
MMHPSLTPNDLAKRGPHVSVLISTITLRGLGMMLTIANQIMFANLLNVKEYSTYILCVTLSVIGGQLSTLGLDGYCLRKIPTALLSGDKSSMQSSITAAIISVSAVTSAIALIVLFVETRWTAGSDLYLVVVVLAFLLGLSRVSNAIFRAFNMPSAAEGLTIVFPQAVILCISWSAVSASSHALLVHTIAVLLSLFLSVGILLIRYSRYWALRQPLLIQCGLVRAGLYLLIISFSQALLSQTDIMMLGLLSDLEAPGIYSVAARAAELAIVPATVVYLVYRPYVTASYVSSTQLSVQRIVTHAARYGFASFVGIALVLIIFWQPFLMLFGEEYSAAFGPMQVLLLAQLINVYAGPVGTILIAVGLEGLVARWLLYTAGINMALNVAFIPLFSYMGAAAATATSIAMWNIALSKAVRRLTGLKAAVL